MRSWEPLLLLAAAVDAARVVELGLQRLGPRAGPADALRRRAAAASPSSYLQYLVNNMTGGGYYANISVGTPPQPQLLVLDTGSSDVWVVSSDANLCLSDVLQEEYGDSCGDTYTATDSSTYELVESDGFSISYLDGTGSSGDFIADTFRIGGAAIDQLQMGLANDTMRGVGVIGLSYVATESSYVTYPNLMAQFQAQGLISTMAFSLYLNDYHAPAGSVLFGGVDTDKFVGELTVLPVLASAAGASSSSASSEYSALAVALEGMKVSPKTGGHTASITFSSDLPAILDSGTTLSYLPGSLASKVFSAAGAYTDNRVTGYTFINCDNSSELSVSLTFGNTTLTVPASQIVLDVFSDVQDQIPSNVPFRNACLFGFQNLDASSSISDSALLRTIASKAASSDYALLGDTFLRSVYAVYDLTNNEIALAPANLNSTTSSIVELSASDRGIPTLTGVPSQQASGTAASTAGGDGTVTVTATATHKSSAAWTAAPGSSWGLLAAAGAACLCSFVGGMLSL